MDRGLTWRSSSTGLPDEVNSIIMDPTHPQTIFAATSTGVYKTADGGLEWKRVDAGLPVPAPSVLSLALSPAGPETVYAGTSSAGVFRTLTGGH